jgi:hypothetical protein
VCTQCICSSSKVHGDKLSISHLSTVKKILLQPFASSTEKFYNFNSAVKTGISEHFHTSPLIAYPHNIQQQFSARYKHTMTSVVSTYWKDELRELSHLRANKSDNHKNRTQRRGELSASDMNSSTQVIHKLQHLIAHTHGLLTFLIPANLPRAN